LKAYHPLWNLDQRKILEEFIKAGFKAIIVSLNSKFFGQENLGRPVDERWIEDLDAHRGSGEAAPTYCGEQGEYHTFVYDGPLFKSRVRVATDRKVLRNGYWFIDLQKASSYGNGSVTAENV
jgi:diphthine-ammonia ligase